MSRRTAYSKPKEKHNADIQFWKALIVQTDTTYSHVKDQQVNTIKFFYSFG
jgi:hypothetical protein